MKRQGPLRRAVRALGRAPVMRSTAASLLALSIFALLTTSVLAGTVISGPATIHPSNFGASLTGYSCDTSEWLFVINHITGSAPSSIVVTFSDASTVTFPLTADQNQNAHYSIAITPSNAALQPTNATAVIAAGTSVGNFVLSHGSCATTTGGGGGITPPPSATPELDSLLLLGSGTVGLAGYVLARMRAGRRQESLGGTPNAE